MSWNARTVLLLTAVTATFPSANAVTQIFDSEADFLLAAGPLFLEDLETTPLVGNSLPMLAFDGFRAVTVPAALKVLDTPESGNHSISAFGPNYLAIFSPSLLMPAHLTLEFEPAVNKLGFVDAE